MFYGWRLLSALCLIFGLGIGGPLFGFGVALPAIARTHGWSMGQASGAVSILILLMGASGPLVGRLMRRFSTRLVILAGGLLIAVGATLTALTNSLLLYYLGAGVLMGTGVGMMALVPGPTLIGRWFVRRRALMSSLYFLSSGVAGFIVVPAVGFLLDTTQNWRAPWIVFAGCGLVGGAIGFIFVRERPEDLGQYPDGMRPEIAGRGAESPRASRVFMTPDQWTVQDALRTPALWCVIFAWVGYGIGVETLISQLVAHLTSIKIATTMAASALGTMTLCSCAGKLVSGVLGDRVEPRFLLAGGILLQLIALIVLVTGHAVPLIYVFAVLFGVGYGMCYVTISLLLTNYFGTGPFPTLYGTAYLVEVVFASLGPVLAGTVFSLTGSYRPVFLGIIGLLVPAGIAALVARPCRLDRAVRDMATVN